MRFATFPDTLILHAARFIEVGYVPRKVDVPVLVPVGDGETLSLDAFVGKGLQPGETELPVDAEAPAAEPIGPQFDAAALEQLQGMGFPLIRCQRALLAVGNPQSGGAETAMNWLFEHMEDANIDAPLPAASGSAAASSSEPTAESISAIVDMGFTPAQARKALRETGAGALDRAMDWIFSHPDDAGDDDSGAGASTSTGASTLAGASKPQAGSASLPASYRLKAVRSWHAVSSLTRAVHLAQGPVRPFGPLRRARPPAGWSLGALQRREGRARRRRRAGCRRARAAGLRVRLRARLDLTAGPGRSCSASLCVRVSRLVRAFLLLAALNSIRSGTSGSQDPHARFVADARADGRGCGGAPARCRHAGEASNEAVASGRVDGARFHGHAVLRELVSIR